jgi:ADP-dependent NAD(P)H-hydrate dehydratase / NAD(P)H-hydrate epimerase
MRPIAGPGRMAAIEESCRSEHGLGDRELMGRAAAALEEALRRSGDVDSEKSICLLAGRGNNGGDGLALAVRLFRAGLKNIGVVHLSGKLSPECGFRLEEASQAGVPLIPWPEGRDAALRAMEGAGLLIDAVSGTGLASPLRETEASLAESWKGMKGKKIALDLPSGFREGMLADDPVFEADETLCIGLVKECLLIPAFRRRAGRIRVLRDGIFTEASLVAAPGQALEIECGDLAGSLKPFASDAYKYSRGNVSALAGSQGGLGASRLCAEAAARSGAGIVRLFVDAEIWQAAASSCGGLIVKALESEDGLSQAEKDESSKASCLVAGPGWGRKDSRKGLLDDILALRRPIVLDADALFALTGQHGRLGSSPALITPHSGEAARLLGRDSRWVLEHPGEAATKLASTYECVALLKGNVDWIANAQGRLVAFDASFPPLACAGSGDVLAGIAAGLMARGLAPFEAACCAVLLHYRAGRLAWEQGGYFMAQDLCQNVSRAAVEAEGGAAYVR